MNVVFVGSLLPPSLLREYPAASVAGNNYQFGLVEQLCLSHNVQALTIPPIRSAKLSRVAFLLFARSLISVPRSVRVSATLSVDLLPFVNVFVVKPFSIALVTLGSVLRALLRTSRDAQQCVVVYNSISYIYAPALLAARITRTPLCAIIADVPLKSHRRQILRRLENYAELRLARSGEMLVALTQGLAADFANARPTIVIDGAVSLHPGHELPGNETNVAEAGRTSTLDVVFTGSLNEASGIELVLSAFELVADRRIHLHIYGAGPQLDAVRNHRLFGHTIFYNGVVSNQAVRTIQTKATLLVSPRVPDGFLTRYTFPSKVLEYLSSGSPVLSNALECFGDDLLSLLNTVDSVTPQDWADAINRICLDTSGEYIRRAAYAREVIFATRTWEAQGQRFAKFLGEFGPDRA